MTATRPVSDERDRILVITGEDLRHQYFVNQLNARFPLVGVMMEAADYPEPTAQSAEEKMAWNWFFDRRNTFEEQAFGPENRTPTRNNPALASIPQGTLNAPQTLKVIQNFRPGFIAVFGTGLLDRQLLRLYPRRIFNLHIGLPGHYRGSACNFWPVHDNQLDKLGASVHLTDPGIDKGEIAAQSTIEFREDDDEQTLAGRVITTGIELMISTIQHWKGETLSFTPSDKIGKLCLRKDFTPGAVLRVRRMVESGELKRQLALIPGRIL